MLKTKNHNTNRNHKAGSLNKMPHFLIAADLAADSGSIPKAIELLGQNPEQIVNQIIEDNPTRVEVIIALALVFHKTNQLEKAEKWYNLALKQAPIGLVYFQLANIYQETARFSQAHEYWKKSLKPPMPHQNTLQVLHFAATAKIRQGHIRQAIDDFRKIINQFDTPAHIHSDFIANLHYLPNPDPQMIFDEHKKWAKANLSKIKKIPSHSNTTDPDRKLRIGYISPDFKMHPIAYFLEPVIESHNQINFETYGYSNLAAGDILTDKLKEKFNHFRDIYNLDEPTIIKQIQHDKIDILIDLAGHSCGNPLTILAHKPAPIQVTYLGYPNTTGLQTIDYRLTDSIADPPGSQQLYTEKLTYLPNCFLCYKSRFAPPRSPPTSRQKQLHNIRLFQQQPQIKQRHPYFMVKDTPCQQKLPPDPKIQRRRHHRDHRPLSSPVIESRNFQGPHRDPRQHTLPRPPTSIQPHRHRPRHLSL